MQIFKFVSIVMFVMSAGCMQSPTQRLNGTLRSVPAMDVSAPSSWVLVMGEQQDGYAMPLDVSAVKFPLGALDGKRVIVIASNQLGGSQQAWIVKSIEPAAQN